MQKGTKGEFSKKKLIEVAANLFLKNGYSNTGINDILTQADISKGSFYFHFSSKKDLALEVAKYYKKQIIEDWLKPLSINPWDIFVDQFTNTLKNSAKDNCLYGCPIAVLGLEIAFIEEELSDEYTDAAKSLMNVFANSLKNSGVDEKVVDRFARKAFVIFEGHILYYRISKDVDTITYLSEDLKELLVLNEINK
jgi:TetR/AcrR family transcriptional repressor of lmrAB and yxaGH operons